MEQKATGTSITTAASSEANANELHRRRVWILTGYAVLFLALLGVIAYYASAYIAQS